MDIGHPILVNYLSQLEPGENNMMSDFIEMTEKIQYCASLKHNFINTSKSPDISKKNTYVSFPII